MDRVIKAADFAAKKHQDQRRKGPGEAPYINHPLGVANILINEGNTNRTRPLLHLLKSPGGTHYMFHFVCHRTKQTTPPIGKIGGHG